MYFVTFLHWTLWEFNLALVAVSVNTDLRVVEFYLNPNPNSDCNTAVWGKISTEQHLYSLFRHSCCGPSLHVSQRENPPSEEFILT